MLIKENQQIYFLSIVNPTLEDQTFETQNIVIDLSGNALKEIDSKKNSHSFIIWNDKDQTV